MRSELMAGSLRLPDLALGELEQAVLEMLWVHGPSAPKAVHEVLGQPISVNTVSSALKRLHEKRLLAREKVSHAYVYRVLVSRSELQRQLIEAIAGQFPGGAGLLAAFVDVAEAGGESRLRELESLVVARIAEGDG